jgi:glycosyltransferase involved in cell wall biosynthesis
MLIERDRRLVLDRKWRLQAVDLCRYGPHRRDWFVEGVRSKVYRWLYDAGVRWDGLAIGSYVRGINRLRVVACSEPADWFIAHTQAALPVAAAAAERWSARLGFDCEDLLAELGTDPPEIVRLIEKAYLPRCDYVSVPSQCIADRLVEQYNIPKPLVLYNAFPLRLAEGLLPPNQRQVRPVIRLYWVGQTIGPGRGIEEAIEALGMLGEGVELHLRGKLAEGYDSTVRALCRKYGVAGKVILHPPVDHDDFIRTMREFDVGLALERPENPNYSRTVTNKLFACLLAGLAVAATNTPGQREVLEQAPSAGFLYPAGDAAALAEGLRRWINDRDALRAAQQFAWEAARDRFCWDQEKEKFLRIFDLSSSPTTQPVSLQRQ